MNMLSIYKDQTRNSFYTNMGKKIQIKDAYFVNLRVIRKKLFFNFSVFSCIFNFFFFTKVVFFLIFSYCIKKKKANVKD